MKAAIRRRHGMDGGSGEWVCVEEAFRGWQTAGGGIDVFAIGTWRTAKVPGAEGISRQPYTLISYEVKVSRSDFRRELYGYQPGANARYPRRVPPWPGKAYFALERSHFFFFATPAGLLRPEEVERRERPADGKGLWVPPEAGLIEVTGAGCRTVVKAPRREGRALTPAETAELIRHAIDPNQNRILKAELAQARREAEYWRKRYQAVAADE